MSEINGWEHRPHNSDSGYLDWVTQAGPETKYHDALFDALWDRSHGMTPEQQNLHFRVAKREVVPFIDRVNEVPYLENKEVLSLYHKYHSPNTGVRVALRKELDTLLQDLEIRVPVLADVIRKLDKKSPIVPMVGTASFVIDTGPFVVYNRRKKNIETEMLLKTYSALRNVSLKRVALMEDQTRILIRALEENGIQLPQECVYIRKQLADLKLNSPDETASSNTREEVGSGLQSEVGQPEDTVPYYENPLPNVKLVSLHEDPGNSAVIANWEYRDNPGDRPEDTSAVHMSTEELQELLEFLSTLECGRFFLTPLEQQEYPGYFQLVTQPCDLVTIQENLDNNPEYGARDFFNHMKLMIGNYANFFGENSYEFEMAARLELEMLKKLDHYESGTTAENLFYEAPYPVLNDPVLRLQTTEANLAPEPAEASAPLETDGTIPPSEADDKLDYTFDEGDLDTSFETRQKNNVPPPKEKPLPQMSWDERMELLETLRKGECGKLFARPLTEEESPKYFDVVKDHRDLTTIKDDMKSVEPTYEAKDFFHDIRLMLDNYTHVFGKGSDEHKMAERFEQLMLECLKDYGERGETAKEHFENAPRATFIENNPPSEADETIPPSEADDGNENSIDEDAFDTSYAQGIRNDYEDDYGEGRDDSYFGQNDDVLDYADENGPDPRTPGLRAPAQQPGGRANPSPSLHGPAEESDGEDDAIKAAWGGFHAAKEYDQAHGHAMRAPGFGTTLARDDEDGPSSQSAGASGPAEATAGEPDVEDTHALKQPDPRDPMPAEQDIIDLTSSPQRQTGHMGSAATKRARESDEEDDSSEDDAPLIKRQKTTAESHSDEQPLSSKPQKPALYAVQPSLAKRSRDDSDDDDEEEREQPSKRKKAFSLSAPEPVAPVAAASGVGGHDDTSQTIEELFEPFQLPPRPAQEAPPPVAAASQVAEPSLASYQNLLRVVRNAQIPPSPIPEPLSPVLAAADGPSSVSPPPISGPPEVPESMSGASNAEVHKSKPGSSSQSAAANEPQPEPATEDLGYTDNGTITVSKLVKLPKYKKKARSKERGRPNRPWVFGYRFGNDYGLYIMSCPTKGCEAREEFTTHPLKQNDATFHLVEQCGHVFAVGDNDDDMVRKTCIQVISDDKKTASIEWARKWNNELMKEYGNEGLEEQNEF